jgi:TRAP-type uncharacterized transport system substrate-binding protein
VHGLVRAEDRGARSQFVQPLAMACPHVTVAGHDDDHPMTLGRKLGDRPTGQQHLVVRMSVKRNDCRHRMSVTRETTAGMVLAGSLPPAEPPVDRWRAARWTCRNQSARQGRVMAEGYRPVAPVDPTNMRAMLFLDAARTMMLSQDWPYRAVSIVMESHTAPGRFAFHGANHPAVIEDVHERRVDVSILNPAALLTMAHRGVGAFDRPREVATIAVLPHDDRLGFAVADRLGFTSLADIAAARYPLRVSVRGSLDACTPIMVDVVLWAHGFSLDDIRAWGGEISYDQPMPNHPSRIGRLERGEIDAIFDEGVVLWADQVAAAGAQFLPLTQQHLEILQARGFRPALIEKSRYPSLARDVPAVDYSGWPIYCRTDTPGALVEQFCQALVSRREDIVWDIGGVRQPPLPLERMVKESPVTPLDVPMHPSAAAVWQQHGYLP